MLFVSLVQREWEKFLSLLPPDSWIIKIARR
jgi:hypothetical protein